MIRTLTFVVLVLCGSLLAAQEPASNTQAGSASHELPSPPMVKTFLDLKYPKEAKKKHIEGEASMKVVVNPDGTVGEISDATGPDVLIEDARRNIEKWRFEPAKRNGQPIAAKLLFTFEYRAGKVEMREEPIEPAHYVQTRIRVSQAVLESIRTKFVMPHPQGAKGTVVLKILVGTDGKVRDIRAIEGNPLINGIAEDAVWHWEFQPYRVNGVPLEVESQITMKFNVN